MEPTAKREAWDELMNRLERGLSGGVIVFDLEPYDSGHLNVGDGHAMYWEVVGSPDGLPAIWLHGGPGASASPDSRRNFHPARYRAVIFDQRGCGRSRSAVSASRAATCALDIGPSVPSVTVAGEWSSVAVAAGPSRAQGGPVVDVHCRACQQLTLAVPRLAC